MRKDVLDLMVGWSCKGAAGGLMLALLAGCAAPARVQVQEKFGSGSMHSRLFDATPVQTCEAGRRALLSQGYLVDSKRTDMVEGSKSFQPGADSHVQMTIRMVCATDGGQSHVTLGFVTGLQDTYTVKKASNSASLGLPALGSLSLPFMSGSESLIKVGSETVSSPAFYESFFDIVRRFLNDVAQDESVPSDTPAAH